MIRKERVKKVLIGAGIGVILILALRGALAAEAPAPAVQKDPAEFAAQVDILFQDYIQLYGSSVGARAKLQVQEKRITALESRVKELEEKCGDTCKK
jgi:hypothetical protein